MRTSFVTLVVSSQGIRKSFSIDHAERLLRMPNNGGWTLPATSKYEFDPATGIRKKPQEVSAKEAESL